MRRLLLLVFLSVSLSSLLAQDQDAPMRDVLYLKNGWVLRGTLQPHSDSIGIVISGGSYFQFHPDQVMRIEQEPWPHGQSTSRAEGPYASEVYAEKERAPARKPKPSFVYPGERGYYFGFATALLMGQGQWSPSAALDLQFYNGYAFSPYLKVGGGVATSLYGDGPLMPFFAEIRGDITTNQNAPHYFARVGYNLPLYGSQNFNNQFDPDLEDPRGGLMTELGLGVNVYTLKGRGWIFALSYRYQQATSTFVDWNGSVVNRRLGYRRIAFTMGTLF